MKVADGTGVAAWVIAQLRAMASARWIRDNSLLGHRSWLAMFWPKGVAHREPSTEQLDGLSPPSRTLVPVSSESTLLGTDLPGSPRFYQNPGPGLAAIYGGAFAAMELTTILNRCHHFRGFVYEHARFSTDKRSIEVVLRPRKGSAAVCSRCHLPAPGYDQLAERRFEFIPLWGFLVFLLYAMRRVECRRCGAVVVEEVPWADGKRTLTKAYMLFLARWARRLSWKETAEAFCTSWEKVFDAVEHVVTLGLEHQALRTPSRGS